jgi:bifunctional NMN adenylyltransferase/nudix hydrolase
MKNYKYNHGFIIIRAQPFHKGHKSLIDKMITECKNITLFLGSTQEKGTIKNPLTFKERKLMIETIYPQNSQIKIFPLPDLSNYDKDKYIQEKQSDRGEWYNYVLKNLKEKNPQANKPEAFYCGNDFDGHWFNDGIIHIEKIERTKQKGYKLISATEIRKMIKNKNPQWKKYIPQETVKLAEKLIKQ